MKMPVYSKKLHLEVEWLRDRLLFEEGTKHFRFLKIVNRKLRNDIAHLKFKIDGEGVIRDSKGSLVDIDEVIEEFWKAIFDIESIFDEIGFTKWISAGKREDSP